MKDVGWTNTTTPRVGADTGVSTAANDAWRQSLSPEAVAICQWVTAGEMSMLGYECDKLPLVVKIRSVAKLSYFSGVAFPKMLYARWKLGGVKYLQTQLQNYLNRFRKISVRIR